MKKSLLLLISVSLIAMAFSGCDSIDTISEPVSAGTESGEVLSSDVNTFISDSADYSEIYEKTELPQNAVSVETFPETQNIPPETVLNISTEASVATESSEQIKPQKITLSQNTVTVILNEPVSIEVTVVPDGASADIVWSSTDSTIASVDQNGTITGISEGACTVMAKDKNNPDVKSSIYVTVKTKAETTASHSINGVTSLTYISGILVVNKTYALPSDYAPGVDEDAKAAFDEMQKAAAAEGLSLYIASGYRSYETQQSLYNGYVARDGKEAADTYSARAGHSEHQTGLAFDLNTIDASFADTPEGKWVAENCYKYGFIIRYPSNKTAITGYMYEPWHIRYLGVNIATSVYQSGLCLEEYLSITSCYEDDFQYQGTASEGEEPQ